MANLMPWAKRRLRSHHAKQEELMQERNMASIDLAAGQVTIGTFPVDGALAIRQFLDTCQSSHRIYGSAGNAKYCLAQRVCLFDQTFWACFVFREGKLRLLEFLPADDASAQSMPEDERTKEAFGALCQLLEKELGFGGTSRRPFSRLWAFSWGEISVVWQMQDLSVHVGIAWQEAGSDQ